MSGSGPQPADFFRAEWAGVVSHSCARKQACTIPLWVNRPLRRGSSPRYVSCFSRKCPTQFQPEHRSPVGGILEMTISRLALGLAITCGMLLTGRVSEAQLCGSGCPAQMKTCVQVARIAKVACTTDCRTTATGADRGPCLRACRVDFRSAQDGCRTDLGSCLDACSSATASTSSSAACLGACGQDLGGCAQDVASTGRACVVGCKGTDDRLGCLESCGAAARSGAEGCASDFGSCRTACGSASTTTTTLPQPQSCEGSEAPACGGTCPSKAQTCQPVGPTCACVGGSTGGAFVR